MSHPYQGRLTLAAIAAILVVAVLAALVLTGPAPALAEEKAASGEGAPAKSGGQAASGELLFYPCTSCHPAGAGQAAKALPNGFKGHSVVLDGHDELGTGSAACLVCHDDAGKDPGKLKVIDGSLIDITGDVARVCYRCHSDKYKEWKVGAHGKNLAKCTASGCHDPHTPAFMYADPTRPFLGTGFQFKALAEREAFTPLGGPPSAPPVETPAWFAAFATLGLAAAGGQAVRLVRGRSKR